MIYLRPTAKVGWNFNDVYTWFSRPASDLSIITKVNYKLYSAVAVS